jgi:glycerophosphoryl diester phosphodiesterase
MSELKIRSAANMPWETIETQRTKARKVASWKWAAHRGAYMEGWEENSIPALIRAKERGFGYSECDLQLTADNQIVISHNPTITGKLNGVSTTLTIASSTAEEVCALTFGPNLRSGYYHPCTLDELLNVAYFVGIGVIIHCSCATTEEIGKQVAIAVIRNGMQGKVIYMPGSVDGAKGIVSVDHRAAIEFCLVTAPVPTDLTEHIALLPLCDYVGFDCQANMPPPAEDIARLRENGLGISWWNVSSSNYAMCLDTKPRALTLVNDNDDFHAWEQAYLDSIKLC